MNEFRKFVAVAAASAALGVVALGATPAAAQNVIVQGWRYNNNPAWADQQPYLGRNWGGYGAPAYGGPVYDNDFGYGPASGYGPAYGYGAPGVEVGTTTYAICPGGYRLGESGRLCWPD